MLHVSLNIVKLMAAEKVSIRVHIPQDYIIEQGMAQHRGRHTGTMAAPELLLLFDLDSASYAYLPPPRAYPPWKTKGNTINHRSLDLF